MADVIKLSIYGLFLATTITLLIGITMLVLQIVFNYVGFVSSDFAIGTCADSYITTKYFYLQYQIEVAFVGTCVGVATLIGTLVISGIIAWNLYQLIKGSQQPINQQCVSPSILSRTKYGIQYILVSVGTLGNVICFGMYLSFWVESKKDSGSCFFSYNQSYLLVLVILSGIWLLGFIILHVFLLMIRGYLIGLENVQKSNKYREMVNLTQQPQLNNPNQKYNHEYTQQHFDPNAEPFENKHPYNKQISPHLKNPNNTQNSTNSKKQKQTFQQYRAKQMKELHNKKNTHQNQTHPNLLYTQQTNQPQQLSPKNQDVLKFYHNDQPNSNYKQQNTIQPKNNNKYNPSRFTSNEPIDHQRTNSFGNQNKNILKPYSPIRILGQNHNEPGKSNHSSGSPYNQDTKKRYQNSPQNQPLDHMNLNSQRPQQSYRGSQQDTRGQLVFYKKAMQKSRREQINENLPQKKNSTNDPYSRNIKPSYSSGEVSFKSPSRFQSKFAEEQNDYLKRNAQNSILPSHNIKEVTGGSRKIIFDDKYSSSGAPVSNFGQSRNLDSSPNQSRSKTKAREGVLTSFIRGKFS